MAPGEAQKHVHGLYFASARAMDGQRDQFFWLKLAPYAVRLLSESKIPTTLEKKKKKNVKQLKNSINMED